MAYEITPSQSDCYPGASVLVNKLGIRDQKQLDENETLIVSVKTLQIELQPLTTEPDFAYYKGLHRALFEELYDWAGQVRTINMSKLRTAFCPASEIEATASEMFARLKARRYFAALPRAELIDELAELYDAVNYLRTPSEKGTAACSGCIFGSSRGGSGTASTSPPWTATA